jgi:hypothetical protein
MALDMKRHPCPREGSGHGGLQLWAEIGLDIYAFYVYNMEAYSLETRVRRYIS